MGRWAGCLGGVPMDLVTPHEIFAGAKPTTIELPQGPSEVALTPQVVSLLGC